MSGRCLSVWKAIVADLLVGGKAWLEVSGHCRCSPEGYFTLANSSLDALLPAGLEERSLPPPRPFHHAATHAKPETSKTQAEINFSSFQLVSDTAFQLWESKTTQKLGPRHWLTLAISTDGSGCKASVFSKIGPRLIAAHVDDLSKVPPSKRFSSHRPIRQHKGTKLLSTKRENHVCVFQYHQNDRNTQHYCDRFIMISELIKPRSDSKFTGDRGDSG